LVFGGIRGSFAFVGLRARVCRGAAVVGIPSKFPVAVDVAAVTGAVSGARLAVFAPEAFVGLGVDEAYEMLVLMVWWREIRTIGIDERKDEEVVAIEKSLGNVVASFVPVDQLRREVLYNWRGNPLSSMHGAMVKHRRLSRTVRTPQVQTVDITSFIRLAGRHPLRLIWKRSV
jgi:hypothetical protein